MKQKIGILTVHKNTNYGANLQAFALCNYINSVSGICQVPFLLFLPVLYLTYQPFPGGAPCAESSVC